MKVKIGDKTYDSAKEPIMCIFSKEEKEHIKSMIPKAKKYCSFPDKYDINLIEKFMGKSK